MKARESERGWPVRLAAGVAALLVAAFFGFVGYHKTFAPLAELARHGAWTVYVPELVGRAVGWSEMACALLLAAGAAVVRARRAQRWAAATLVLNQIAAAGIHLEHGETAALPQNAVLIGLLALVAWVAGDVEPERSPMRRRRHPGPGPG